MFHRQKVYLPVAAMALLSFVWTANVFAGLGQEAARPQEARTNVPLSEAVAALESQLREQQAQIDKLTAALAQQQQLLDNQGKEADDKSASDADQQRSKPTAPPADSSAAPSPTAPVTEQEFQQVTTKVDKMGKQLESNTQSLSGFKFSGDFRLRSDGQWRAGNDVSGPLQNVRARYRLRLNVDRDFDPHFKA